MDSFEYVVVGGGIVGLATALTLLRRRPGASLLLVEKEARVAAHQTGHNSGVIHAGIYYRPGSLKAVLCKDGARATREFCDGYGVPYRDTGKLIVATKDAELPRMQALYDRALVNGLDVRLLSAGELREREPNVTGLGAIHLSSTGIVDYRAVCAAMAAEVARLGGVLRLGTRVVGIRERSVAVEVDLVNGGAGTGRVRAGRLVVCGGIQADRLACLAGLRTDVRMVPFRGEYYRLPPARSGLVSTLIYPVPDPDLPFLGVHLTLMMDGSITVGPNAVLGLSREGYPKGSIDVADVRDMMASPGLWRLARRQLRTGVVEQWNSVSKHGYLGLVRRYCPSLTVEDLTPYPAGIRAQAVRRDGSMVEDFLIERTDRMVHVLNAPSPAATSALPIARAIAARVLGEPDPYALGA